MRIALWTLTLVIGACLLANHVNAQDKGKEVTLKGTVLCAKCALKEGTACRTAIQVKENGKDVVYYFVDKGSSESYHEHVCGGEKSEGTVVGTVSEKDGKKLIAPKKVDYAKK